MTCHYEKSPAVKNPRAVRDTQLNRVEFAEEMKFA
jgi:hypothetical protein